MTTTVTRRLGAALLALALGLMLAGRAQAAPVTFEFTGTVDFSGFATILPGSGVTGSYTFDSTFQDQDGTPTLGLYRPVDLEIHFDGGSSVTTSTAEIRIGNAPSDSYVVLVRPPVTFTGSFAGLDLVVGGLSRVDRTGEAFADTSLPLQPPALASLPVDQS